jgi:hypothetical protein
MITIDMNKIKRFFKIQVDAIVLNETYLMETRIIVKYLLKNWQSRIINIYTD